MPQELNLRELSEQVVSETEKIIVGKTRQIELIFMAVLSQGHILLDLRESGTYVVTELIPPKYYLPAETPTQTVTVRYG